MFASLSCHYHKHYTQSISLCKCVLYHEDEHFSLSGCPAEDQVYNECGSACAPTCRERNPRPCTLQCVAGCQCPNDTVLDEESNKCVTVDQCRKIIILMYIIAYCMIGSYC